MTSKSLQADTSTDRVKGFTMNNMEERRRLLSRAQEAEEMAAITTDSKARNKWLEIARHYRALAVGIA